MSISRFDRLPKYDWNWQTSIPVLPQLNFEALDSVMGSVQQGIDLNTNISTKMPNVLPVIEDQLLFHEYKQTVDQGLKQVTDTYANQGLKAGQVAQNQFIKTVQNDWLPGGRAALLNARHAGYTQAQEDIKKHKEKDIRGVNSQYAEYQLKEQLEAPINYNAATRTGRSITSPGLFADPELRKNATEALKGIQEDGNTQFLSGMDGKKAQGWITKIETEGRSEEKLKLVMQAMMELPEYAGQLDRDTAVQMMGIDSNLTRRQYNKQIDSNVQQYKDKYETIKNSKDPKDIREFQQFLSQNGYSVATDGEFGSETDTQAKKFIQDMVDGGEEKKNSFDVTGFTRKNIEQNYLDYAGGFANQKIKKDLVFDKAWALRQKISADRANTQALIASNEKLSPQKADDTSVVPTQAVQLGNFVDALDKNKQTQVSAYQQAETAKANDPMFKGWKNEDIAAAYREFENTVRSNPNANPNDLKAMFNQKFSNYLQGQGNTGTPGADLFDYVSQGRSSPTIASIDTLWSADESVNSMTGLISNYGETYSSTPEGQVSIQKLRNYGYGKGLNDSQLIADVASNPNNYKTSMSSNVSIGGAFIPSQSTFDRGSEFISAMTKDIQKQSTLSPDLYKDQMSNSAILQGKDDDFLVPVLDRYGQDINNGAYGNYVSEGGQGLLFYEMPKSGEGRTGAKIDAGTFKYETMAVDLDENGKTVIVFSGKGKNGKTEVPAYTRMTPTAYQIADIKQGLTGQLVKATESGNYQKQLEIGKKIAGLGDVKWSDYRNFDVAGKKLSYQNTSEQNIYQTDQSGANVPMQGFRFSNDKITETFSDGKNEFEIEIVQAWSPYSKENKTLNVRVVRDNKNIQPDGKGLILGRVAIPTSQGTLDYGSAANVIITNNNKQSIATVSVEMEATKIPEGNYIESPVNSRLLKSN